MTRSSGLVAAALAIAACETRLPDEAPRLASVEPPAGWAATETRIVVRGAGFRARAGQTAQGAPEVDATFRLWLGGAELDDVRRVSGEELRATVPAGLPAGVHALELRDPNGARASLADAFTVLDAEAAEAIADPFGDGAPFSFVFGYDEHLFLGPSGDGSGLVRCAPDGSGCASVALRFQRDTTALVAGPPETQTSVSANACPDDLVTLGATGRCDPVLPQTTACACGPDYEVGRGIVGAFLLGPEQDEWLVAMGRAMKAGELNYLYMTRETSSPLRLAYVDLYAAMPPEALIENVSSMAALGDRLYVGLQVDSADRPRVAVLTRTPEASGLDATSDEAFAMTFQQTAMGETASSAPPVSQVDAMLGFAGRLFVANRKAVLVSRTGAPPADLVDGRPHFDDCTPQDPAAWEASGIVRYAIKQDLTPADRGVSHLVAWAGRLYLARNTRAAVPELWVFTPRYDGAGGLLPCAPDRSDWRRIATDMGTPTRTHASALFASGRFLYYGMDDAAAGVALFRTASPAPRQEADFTGRHGCAAPCEPLGRAGFGSTANTRFFDARAIRFETADQVWVTAGDGASAVRVFRVADE